MGCLKTEVIIILLLLLSGVFFVQQQIKTGYEPVFNQGTATLFHKHTWRYTNTY